MSSGTQNASRRQALKNWRWRQSHRLKHFLFRLNPQLFMPTRYKAILKSERGKDAERNEKLQIPKSQAYKVHAIIGVEYYAPSHTAGLMNALDANGWKQISASKAPISDWIKRWRMTMTGGSWINIGALVREPQKHHFVGESNVSEVPDWCEWMEVRLRQLTPSLTACIAVFYLRSEHELSLTEIANVAHATEIEPSGQNGYMTRTPKSIKEDSIDSQRVAWAGDVRAWFGKHLPGLFSKSTARTAMPLMEIGSITNIEPFAVEGSPDHSHQTCEMLGLAADWLAWKSNDLNSLKFSEGLRRSRDELDGYSIAAISSADHQSLQKSGFTEPALALVDKLRSTIPGLGIHYVLRHYTQMLSDTRDSLCASLNRREALSQANSLKARHASLADIDMVLGELRDDLLNENIYREIEGFSRQHEFQGSETALSEAAKIRQTELAQRLERLNGSVNQMISERQSILTSTAMLRLAQIATLLALVTIFTSNWAAVFELVDKVKAGVLEAFFGI